MKKSIWPIILVAFISCGKKEPSPPEPRLNKPLETLPLPKEKLWDKKYQKKFVKLPLEGKVESNQFLWSGDHWSFKDGSINRRWPLENEINLNEAPPSEESIGEFSLDDLSFLSPSEKFDLLNGSYSYPLKSEIQLKINPNALSWEGLGNGWAMATLLHAEPSPVI